MDRSRWLLHIALAGVLLASGPKACSDSETRDGDDDGGQGGSSPASGGAGGAGGGGPSPAMICFACAGPLFEPGGDCESEITACKADAECDAWNSCYEGCFTAPTPTPTCFADCKTEHASAQPLYDAVVACVCGACLDECNVACQ